MIHLDSFCKDDLLIFIMIRCYCVVNGVNNSFSIVSSFQKVFYLCSVLIRWDSICGLVTAMLYRDNVVRKLF